MDPLFRSIDANPVFRSTAAPYLVVDRDLYIRAVNPAYLAATGRDRDDLLHRYLFDAFPDNPSLPEADGVRNLNASLERVLRHARRDRMPLQRYDVPLTPRLDEFQLKYWAPVNSPLADERGRPIAVLHHVEDVTPVLTSLEAEAHTMATGDVGLSRQVTTIAHDLLSRTESGAEINQLRGALRSRIVIEQAKGILMAQLGCGPDDAFTLLRGKARRTQTRLEDVCAAVINRAARHPTSGLRGPEQSP